MLATWNIGTLTCRRMELVETLVRRKVNIACLEETKWIGVKVKEINNIEYKLCYTVIDKDWNGVSIVIDEDLKEDIVPITGKWDIIILVKLVLEYNIITVYALKLD